MENITTQPINPSPETNSVPSNILPTPPPRRKSKMIIVLIILFVLIFLGSAAAFGIKFFNENKKSTVLVPESSPTPTTNPNTDMLTYENTTYGFTAKYPKGWTILPGNQDNNVTFSGPPVGNGEANKPALVNIQVLETAKLQPGWENSNTISPFSSKTLTNGNYTYYITANTFTIGGQPTEQVKILAVDTMNQILSTLKFTNTSTSPTSDATSTWSTYTNFDFDLAIKYPQSLPLYNENTPSQAGERGYTIAHFAIPPTEPGMGPFTGVFIRMYSKDTSPAYLISQKNNFESLLNLPIQGTKTIEGYIYTRLPNDPSVPSAYVFETQAVPNYPSEVLLYTKSYILKNNGNLIVATVIPEKPNTQNDKFTEYFQEMIKTLKFTN